MNKIKVLHILSSKTYNGAENVVCQINSMLQGAEDNIEIVYCSLDGPVRSHIEDNGIRFVPVSKISKKEIAHVIRKVKPDIIHAHDMRAGFVAALACGRTPLVSHIHNNNFDSRGLSLKSVLYLYAAIKAKHMTNILKKMPVLIWNIIEKELKSSVHTREMKRDGLHRIFCCMLGKRILTFSIAKLKRNLLKLMRIPLV